MSDKDKGPPGGPGQVLAVPLLLFGLGLAAYYEFFHKTAGSWFCHHPSSMMVAFVALAGNAALIKKKGGYENTKMHGNVMSLATAIALFGSPPQPPPPLPLPQRPASAGLADASAQAGG